jgi:hypothetical protein
VKGKSQVKASGAEITANRISRQIERNSVIATGKCHVTGK